jgi:acetyl-CoA carboxylase biotin carboxyl carrier protein
MASIKITSDMAGTVCKVSVEVGSQVGEDDTLAILESMKMEIPVGTPRPGRVASIHVTEGDMVNEGDLLLTIETSAG